MESRRLIPPLAVAALLSSGIPSGAAAQEGGATLGEPSPSDPDAARVGPPVSEEEGGGVDEGEEGSPGDPYAPPDVQYEAPDAVEEEPGAVPEPPESEPPDTYGDDEAGGGRYPSGADALTTSEAEGVRIPSRIATRLRVLDADFGALSSRGGSSLVDGILSILTGGLSITLAYFVDDEFLTPYLYVYGGAGVARGIIDLALVPDPSEPAIAFAHMPMGSMEEVRARLRYGEEQLESLASRTQLARILDSSINIVAGVAVVPLYLGPNDFEVDIFGTFVLIGAGISVVSGVINLLSRSEAERRWSAYQDLRERLESEESAGLRLRVGAVPIPGGGAVSVGGIF